MSILQKITDWPFENKWKTSALVLALLHLPAIRNGEVDISERGFIHYHHWDPPQELSFLLFLGSAYWLSFLGKIPQPRLKNFLKGTNIALRGIYADFKSDNQKQKEYGLELLQYIRNLPPKTQLPIKAGYHLRKGEFGEAMDLYTQYLDSNLNKEKTFDEYINSVLLTGAIRIRSIIQNNTSNLLREAFYDLREGNIERLFEKDWKNILEKKQDSLELKVIHAMFLTTCKRPEATGAWKAIEKSLEKKPLGKSRNEVYEFNTNYFREVIIIKKGSSLRKEWENLQLVQEALKGKEIICAIGLAYYKEEEERDVLIVKRRQGKNLEEFCKNEVSKEEKEEQGKKALGNIAILHSLDINLEEYSPIKEFERRVLSRFGYNRKAELLLQTYQEFYDRRTKGERKVSSHGDFYPSNILDGGTFFDLETMCLANPWLDIETFLEAPQWEGLNKENILNAYKEKSPINMEGREFYRIHTNLCQIGSFSQKNPDTSRYYSQKLKENLAELQEDGLRERLNKYLYIQS
ncbi:MAG: hypothetical protein Q8R18_02580 [bacterium]|nr:hypothetical protein [bacterium]